MPSLDLQTYLEDDQLVLQGVCSDAHPDGKAYTIASPSAKTVLQLKRMMQLWGSENDTELSKDDIEALAALTTGEDGQPVDIVARIMGPAYQQMLDDGVSGQRMEKIANIVLTYYGRNSQLARQIVDAVGESQARPNRKTRRAAGQRAGSKSSRASGVTKAPTRSRASTSVSKTPGKPEAKAG